MLTDSELLLNRVAQGHISEAEGLSWFESLLSEERQQALHLLSKICTQSHPLAEEVPVASNRAGLKSTFTPCVLAGLSERPEQAFPQIVALPANEQTKAFRLLLALFCIADDRRRKTRCVGGCTHEWHNLPAL